MKNETSNNRNWNDSEYSKLVRIKAYDLEYLKETKENMSLAAFLSIIIKFYRDRAIK